MHLPSEESDEESVRLHGEDTEMGERRRESCNKGCELTIICDFLLWTMFLGRMMSLPGVFGAVIYGLQDRHGAGGGLLTIEHITMLPSNMVASLPGVAGAFSERQ